MNNWNGDGKIGRDAVVKFTKTGKKVVNLSVALYAGKNQDGTYKDSMWIQVICWDRIADIAEKAKAGDTAVISGILSEPQCWTGKDGTIKAQNQITALAIGINPKSGVSQTSNAPPPEPQGALSQFDDDDIPF